MKKRWITIALLLGVLMLAAFRYSLIEQEDQLPDQVRLGSLWGTKALAEEESAFTAPARPGNGGWFAPMATARPTATVRPTEVPVLSVPVRPQGNVQINVTTRPTEVPEVSAAATVRPTQVPEMTTAATVRPTQVPEVSAAATISPTQVLEPTETISPTEIPVMPAEPQTGEAQEDEGADIAAEPSPTPAPRLKNGDSGSEVKALQQKLSNLGFMNGKIDGKFGKQTEQAVIAFKEHLYQMEQERLAAERALAEQAAREEAERLALEMQTVDEDVLTEDVLTEGEMPDGDAIEGEMPDANGEKLIEGEIIQSNEDDQFDEVDEIEELGEIGGGSDESEEPVQEKPIFDGNVDEETYRLLMEDGFDVYHVKMTQGVQGVEVSRLQKRLKALGYLPGNADGIYGAKTIQAVKSFQRSNKLTVDGIAGEKTQRMLFSENAKKPVAPTPPALNVKYSGPYALQVSTANQRVYAYAWSEQDGAYTKLVRTMVCSTGLPETPTPKGTFYAVGPVTSWGYFPQFEVWAQYLYRIKGPYLFHSVLYDEADESTLRAGSLYKLGSPASHGCVRLNVEDAKWIYKNCPAGTSVTVY